MYYIRVNASSEHSLMSNAIRYISAIETLYCIQNSTYNKSMNNIFFSTVQVRHAFFVNQPTGSSSTCCTIYLWKLHANLRSKRILKMKTTVFIISKTLFGYTTIKKIFFFKWSLWLFTRFCISHMFDICRMYLAVSVSSLTNTFISPI